VLAVASPVSVWSLLTVIAEVAVRLPDNEVAVMATGVALTFFAVILPVTASTLTTEESLDAQVTVFTLALVGVIRGWRVRLLPTLMATVAGSIVRPLTCTLVLPPRDSS